MSFINSITGGASGAMQGFASGGWYGALAGGIAGTLSGFGEDYNNIQQKKAITDQNRMTLASWRMQNAYNSPVEQMARLREAGLNPMLVYGGGNVTGNSSTSIGDLEAYGAKMNSMAGIQGVQAIADLENTKANTTNTKMNTQSTEASIGQTKANTLATYQDITNMQTANEIQQAQLQQELQNVEMGAMDLEIAREVQGSRLQTMRNQLAIERKRQQHEKFQESGTFAGNVAKFLGGTSAAVGNALDVAGRVSRRDPVYVRSYNPTYNYRR